MNRARALLGHTTLALAALLGSLTFPSPTEAASSTMCHYEYGVWNVQARTTVKRIQVAKPRIELRPDEIDSWGCTPCIEDQVQLELSNGIQFQACQKVAGRFYEALEAALAAGAKIAKVVGYRPSLSRGPLDAEHTRTQLSNHAYGSAIDINDEHNGLYHNCIEWSGKCRLMRGGRWQPKHPLGLTRDHPAVLKLLEYGFKWGGDMEGNQKDMMHFSKTGY